MSSTLYWRPAAEPEDRPSLPVGFKLMLRDRYGGIIDDVRLSETDIPFFEGILTASAPDSDNTKGATAIIAAIRQHGEIMLYEDNF